MRRGNIEKRHAKGGSWSMINSKANTSLTHSFRGAPFRKVVTGEMLKTADFNHHWLYGKDELPNAYGKEASCTGWSARKSIVLN